MKAIKIPPLSRHVFSVSSDPLLAGATGPRGSRMKRSKALRFGAGEGIRTLDPNLGKVVLYP